MFCSDSQTQLIKAAKCMNRRCFVENGAPERVRFQSFAESCLPHDVPCFRDSIDL